MACEAYTLTPEDERKMPRSLKKRKKRLRKYVAGLGTLALGAVGVRRLRKRRSEASQPEES